MSHVLAPERCEIAIRGGAIVDGTGSARFAADVAIVGDRIVAVGDLSRTSAVLEIDATGRIVAPGFIDAHTHDDGALVSVPDMPFKVTQGVTTVVAGNCGFSLAPLTRRGALPLQFRYLGDEENYRYPSVGDYVAALDERPPAVNVAVLVGHSTLRVGAMGDVNRPANGREIEAMRAALGEGLAAGAIGFSTGLDYPTNAAATTDEVVAVAEALKSTDGLYAAHTRDYVHDIDGALEEVLEIGRRVGVAMVISHHQGDCDRNYGHAPRTLGLIDRARRSQRVGLDVYPYTAGSGTIMLNWIEMVDKVVITWSDPHPKAVGRELNDLAREWGISRIEAAERLVPGGGNYFALSEEDVRAILAYPHTMIGSDGLVHEVKPHPRLWGTFPKVLGHYVRELGLLSLEDGIRKMTSLPARRFGFRDRGELRPGAFADVVVFDPEGIRDLATYETPDVPSIGIDAVLVNGVPVLSAGRATGERPGRVVRRDPSLSEG